ncbi:hypothetical protein EJ08DRAFT_647700 [Tothia fuscella]|uniref:Uncharacterized protein n=1 Tax=Tothia fuscella TaxID=1048955 RepID=A0A9P4U0N0_9PEZI|nr:hypothetical protein EJ08DRAFT_647700 [Tothia fuscella]
MDETLKSVLCRGNWRFDPTGSALHYRETNTGYVCMYTLFISYLIAQLSIRKAPFVRWN